MDPLRIKLKLYQPHEAQKKFHASKARYRVAAWGRQSGKSTACINDMLKRAWERPATIYWYVAPTYRLAKIVFRRIKRMLKSSPEVITGKSETELRIELVNGSVLQMISGKEYNNLRGETLHGAIIDEVRDQHPDLWPLVIRPMLATTKGWCAFVSTPNGFDSFYDLFERAKQDKKGRWEAFQAPSTCSPYFTKEELEDAREDMSEAEFDQEINANFRDLHTGKAYLNFGAHNLAERSPFLSPHLGSLTGEHRELVSPYMPILIGLDFNLSPMAWSLGQERGGDFYWFDEIWLEGSHTQEAAQELVERILELKAQGLKAEPNVILAGDATANAGQRAAAGESDYMVLEAMLKEAGITFRNDTPDSNPLVKDRVNTVNAKLRSAAGASHLWLHPTRCPMLKRDFERVSWKKGAQAILDQKTNPELTHASDGVGYAVNVRAPMRRAGSAGKLRMVKR